MFFVMMQSRSMVYDSFIFMEIYFLYVDYVRDVKRFCIANSHSDFTGFKKIL